MQHYSKKYVTKVIWSAFLLTILEGISLSTIHASTTNIASISDDVSFERSLQTIRTALAERTPNCFISYGWEDNLQHPNHIFARRLCDDLKKAGVNAVIDVNDLVTGELIEDFTRKIRQYDYFVITVLTPTFKQRASQEGKWLHHEVRLIKERFNEGDSFFYVPLLVEGDMDLSIPDDLEPAKRLCKDFRSINSYNNNIIEILNEKLLKRNVGSEFKKSRVERINCSHYTFPKSLNTQGKVFVDRVQDDGNSYLCSIYQNLFKLTAGRSSCTHVTLCTLEGMGGVGKTTLAVEYAWMYGDCYDVIFWIDASSKESLKKSYVRLLKKLLKRELSNDEQLMEKEELVSEIIENLEHSSDNNVLLICDNAESSNDIDELLSLSKGHILCTSRCAKWLNPITVGLLHKEEAIELLYNVSKIDHKEEDIIYVDQLVDRCLGRLSLAVTQAGSYIRERYCEKERISFKQYMEFFDDVANRLDLLSYEVPNDIASNWKGDDPSKRAVITTWHLTMNKLGDTAQWLMDCFSYMEPNMIPIAIFYGEEEKKVQNAIRDLAAYSMINREDDYISIHQILQLVARIKYEAIFNESDDLGVVFKNILTRWKKYWEDAGQKYGIDNLQLILAAFSEEVTDIPETNIISLNQLSYFNLHHLLTIEEHVIRLRLHSSLKCNTVNIFLKDFIWRKPS
jgi:hypothetical protein